MHALSNINYQYITQLVFNGLLPLHSPCMYLFLKFCFYLYLCKPLIYFNHVSSHNITGYTILGTSKKVCHYYTTSNISIPPPPQGNHDGIILLLHLEVFLYQIPYTGRNLLLNIVSHIRVGPLKQRGLDEINFSINSIHSIRPTLIATSCAEGDHN